MAAALPGDRGVRAHAPRHRASVQGAPRPRRRVGDVRDGHRASDSPAPHPPRAAFASDVSPGSAAHGYADADGDAMGTASGELVSDLAAQLEALGGATPHPALALAAECVADHDAACGGGGTWALVLAAAPRRRRGADPADEGVSNIDACDAFQEAHRIARAVVDRCAAPLGDIVDAYGDDTSVLERAIRDAKRAGRSDDPEECATDDFTEEEAEADDAASAASVSSSPADLALAALALGFDRERHPGDAALVLGAALVASNGVSNDPTTRLTDLGDRVVVVAETGPAGPSRGRRDRPRRADRGDGEEPPGRRRRDGARTERRPGGRREPQKRDRGALFAVARSRVNRAGVGEASPGDEPFRGAARAVRGTGRGGRSSAAAAAWTRCSRRGPSTPRASPRWRRFPNAATSAGGVGVLGGARKSGGFGSSSSSDGRPRVVGAEETDGAGGVDPGSPDAGYSPVRPERRGDERPPAAPGRARGGIRRGPRGARCFSKKKPSSKKAAAGRRSGADASATRTPRASSP